MRFWFGLWWCLFTRFVFVFSGAFSQVIFLFSVVPSLEVFVLVFSGALPRGLGFVLSGVFSEVLFLFSAVPSTEFFVLLF
jgi:hypothetical protein